MVVDVMVILMIVVVVSGSQGPPFGKVPAAAQVCHDGQADGGGCPDSAHQAVRGDAGPHG